MVGNVRSTTVARWLLASVLALWALGLGGCASGYVVDSRVNTFGTFKLTSVPTQYRFEVLPSQQWLPGQETALQALAVPALAGVGLVQGDSKAPFTVQLSVRVQPELSPWAYDGGPRMWRRGLGFGPPIMEPSWVHREVGLIVRDVSAQKVVYETHAYSDGPWSDDNAVLPAMFSAALQGFPNPPQGMRQVNVPVATP